MFSTDGFSYRLITWIYYFALLNVMFLLSSALIVTIPAAVSALFGVVRKLNRGDDTSIFREYLKQFVDNFRQSIVVGGIMLLVGLFWFADIRLVHYIDADVGILAVGVVWLVGLLYVGVLIHIFPLMVHGYFSVRQLLMYAFRISLYQYHLTLLNVAVIASLLFLGFQFPFFILFFYFSLVAYVTFWIVNLKFNRLWPSETASPLSDFNYSPRTQ